MPRGGIPLALIALAVVIGCIGLGAPPRMESVEGAPEWARIALEGLLPLTAIHVLTFAAAAVILLRRRIPEVRGALRPLILFLVIGVSGTLPLAWGFVADAWAGVDGDDLAIGWWRLTLWPAGSVDAVGLWLAIAASTLAVRCGVPPAGTGSSPATAARVLVFVALIAGAECAYGLLATHIVGDDTILGLAKVSSMGRVTGTFVMPSLLATLAAMGACCATALALRAVTAADRAGAARWSGVLAVCVVAGVLTYSRWMIVAIAAGLVVTAWLGGGVLLRDGWQRAGRALRSCALAVPVAACAVAVSLPSLRERFALLWHYVTGEPGAIEPRFAGWESAWALFREAPILGTGLGSFARAVHLTQSVDAPEELWYAHCEPLNLLADGGVVALALVLWWLIASFREGRVALRGDRESALLAAGATGGAVAVLVAGLADFPTQFAVIAMPFAALLALPGALARGLKPSPDTENTRVVRRLAVVLLAVAFAVQNWIFVAPRVAHTAAGRPPGATDGERLLVVGREALTSVGRAASPAAAFEQATDATETLRQAARAEPFLDATHLWHGLGHVTLLQLTSDVDAADAHRAAALRSFARARFVSRGHADVNLQIGLLYLDLLGTEPNPEGAPGDTAMAALREAGALVPQAFSRAWREAVARGLPPAALEALVPDRPHARRVWAAHLRTLGRAAEAEKILEGLSSPGGNDR